MVNTSAEIGRELRELRKQAGRSQTEVAYLFGISTPSLYLYEAGKTAVKVADLPKWAYALNTTTSELVRRFGLLDDEVRA